MLLTPSSLGDYRLLEVLASRGTGEIYLAQDSRTARQVVLKVINIDELQQESPGTQRLEKLFADEMQAIQLLDHPSILPVLETGQARSDAGSFLYLAMPYCPHGSLADWLERVESRATLSLADVALVLSRVAEALAYAHQRGVLHRDVKPTNLLLSQEGSLQGLQLADFGVASLWASLSDKGLSQSTYVRGTAPFLAPEVWDGKAVAASDQYALAVLAFDLLTGTFPFQGSLGQIIHQHRTAQPPAPSSLNTQLDAAVDAIIARALAKEPTKRFPSVQAFAQSFGNVSHLAQPQRPLAASSGAPTVLPEPVVIGEREKPAPAAPTRVSPMQAPSPTVSAADEITLPSLYPPSPLPHPVTPAPLPVLPLPRPAAPVRVRRGLPPVWVALLAVGLALVLFLTCGAVLLQAKKPGPLSASLPPSPAGRTVVSSVLATQASTPTLGAKGTAVPTATAYAPISTPEATPSAAPTLTPTATPTPGVKHQTLVDNLNDWSKVYSHTTNLEHDQNNSQWMHGDTSLVARTASTHEEVIWHLEGVTSFQAVVYFWPSQANTPLSDLGVYVSADGSTWSAVTPAVNGVGGNWVQFVYSLNNLSHVNFVKLRWLSTRQEYWAQQIGQVTLRS